MHDAILYPLSYERCISTVEFKTDITETGSGGEYRIAAWDDALVWFDAVHGIRSLTDLRALVSFHRRRKGKARSFLVRDLMDFQAVFGSDTQLMAFGTGDGGTTDFQLSKTYSDSFNSDVRPIAKAEKNTIKIYVNSVLKTEGTHYNFLNGYEGNPQLCTKDGLVRFTAGNIPPSGHVLEWSGRFYVPVRFAEDKVPADEIFMNMAPADPGQPLGEWIVKTGAGPLPSVLMREVREIT